MILYVSRINKEFCGGADNLHVYIRDEFLRENANRIKDKTVEYADNTLWDDQNGFKIEASKNPEFILIESSCFCSMREVLPCIESAKPIYDLSKVYIFMHSSILSCEDQQMEKDLSPSLYDQRDLSIYYALARMGVHFLYASANIAHMSKLVIGNGEYFPIQNFYSGNTNDRIDIAHQQVPNKNVLFTTGYFHPAAGNIALMECIRKSDVNEFQWYIVGNFFEDKFKDKEGNFWSEHYADVVSRPDVHFEGFKSGRDEIKPYFQKCYFNLILSTCETYSFKALEATSYGCMNVTTKQNDYLPWTSQAIKFDSGDTMLEFASNLLEALRHPNVTPNQIDIAIRYLKTHNYDKQFGNVDHNKCVEYILWYFRKILNISRQPLIDVLPQIFEGEYNRI